MSLKLVRRYGADDSYILPRLPSGRLWLMQHSEPFAAEFIIGPPEVPIRSDLISGPEDVSWTTRFESEKLQTMPIPEGACAVKISFELENKIKIVDGGSNDAFRTPPKLQEQPAALALDAVLERLPLVQLQYLRNLCQNSRKRFSGHFVSARGDRLLDSAYFAALYLPLGNRTRLEFVPLARKDTAEVVYLQIVGSRVRKTTKLDEASVIIARHEKEFNLYAYRETSEEKIERRVVQIVRCSEPMDFRVHACLPTSVIPFPRGGVIESAFMDATPYIEDMFEISDDRPRPTTVDLMSAYLVNPLNYNIVGRQSFRPQTERVCMKWRPGTKSTHWAAPDKCLWPGTLVIHKLGERTPTVNPCPNAEAMGHFPLRWRYPGICQRQPVASAGAFFSADGWAEMSMDGSFGLDFRRDGALARGSAHCGSFCYVPDWAESVTFKWKKPGEKLEGVILFAYVDDEGFGYPIREFVGAFNVPHQLPAGCNYVVCSSSAEVVKQFGPAIADIQSTVPNIPGMDDWENHLPVDYKPGSPIIYTVASAGGWRSIKLFEDNWDGFPAPQTMYVVGTKENWGPEVCLQFYKGEKLLTERALSISNVKHEVLAVKLEAPTGATRVIIDRLHNSANLHILSDTVVPGHKPQADKDGGKEIGRPLMLLKKSSPTSISIPIPKGTTTGRLVLQFVPQWAEVTIGTESYKLDFPFESNRWSTVVPLGYGEILQTVDTITLRVAAKRIRQMGVIAYAEA